MGCDDLCLDIIGWTVVTILGFMIVLTAFLLVVLCLRRRRSAAKCIDSASYDDYVMMRLGWF